MNELSLSTRGALLGVSATILIALVRAPSLELPRWLFTMREPFEVRLIWSIVEAMPFSLGAGMLLGALLREPPVGELPRMVGNVFVVVTCCLIGMLVFLCIATGAYHATAIYVVMIASLHIQALRVWRDA